MKTFSLVIPLYNQVTYTKQCLESVFLTCDPVTTEVIVIDNASTDGTQEYLTTVSSKLITIANEENRGFAGACNQGIMRASSPWIVVMNNDVIVTKGWLEGLSSAAADFSLDCVTPGIREGELNYPIALYAPNYTAKMKGVLRRHTVNGICFAAHRSVFDAIGLFDENFLYGQYEDSDLFMRMRKAGFRLGTTGRAFIHHYGSVTQKAMGVKSRVSPHVLQNKRYFIEKWQQSRLERFYRRNYSKLITKVQSSSESIRYGHSLFEKLINGKLRYY